MLKYLGFILSVKEIKEKVKRNNFYSGVFIFNLIIEITHFTFGLFFFLLQQ